MANSFWVGENEIESGYIIEGGAFRATVMIRSKRPGAVRQVGYVFEEGFPESDDAMAAAARFAVLASLKVERLLASADLEFAMQ